MKDRKIKFDGARMTANPYGYELVKMGIAVGVIMDDKTGKVTYALHRIPDDPKNMLYPTIAEFETTEELNNMVRLLLPPESRG